MCVCCIITAPTPLLPRRQEAELTALRRLASARQEMATGSLRGARTLVVALCVAGTENSLFGRLFSGRGSVCASTRGAAVAQPRSILFPAFIGMGGGGVGGSVLLSAGGAVRADIGRATSASMATTRLCVRLLLFLQFAFVFCFFWLVHGACGISILSISLLPLAMTYNLFYI